MTDDLYYAKIIFRKKVVPILVLLAVVLVLGLICAYLYNTVQYILYDVGSFEVRDFSKNKKYFDTVAERALALFDEEKAKNGGLDQMFVKVSSDGGGLCTWELECRTDTETYYELTEKASEEEFAAYKRLRELFTDSEYYPGLASVKVSGDRITFITGTTYEVIYMRNGSKPDIDGYDSYYLQRLSPRWFQVTGKINYDE